MASVRMFAKMVKKPKFEVRYRNRCQRCGRARGTTGSSLSAASVSGSWPWKEGFRA